MALPPSSPSLKAPKIEKPSSPVPKPFESRNPNRARPILSTTEFIERRVLNNERKEDFMNRTNVIKQAIAAIIEIFLIHAPLYRSATARRAAHLQEMLNLDLSDPKISKGKRTSMQKELDRKIKDERKATELADAAVDSLIHHASNLPPNNLSALTQIEVVSKILRPWRSPKLPRPTVFFFDMEGAYLQLESSKFPTLLDIKSRGRCLAVKSLITQMAQGCFTEDEYKAYRAFCRQLPHSIVTGRHAGGVRFNERPLNQRSTAALMRLSNTMTGKQAKELGVILKNRRVQGKSHNYRLTKADKLSDDAPVVRPRKVRVSNHPSASTNKRSKNSVLRGEQGLLYYCATKLFGPRKIPFEIFSSPETVVQYIRDDMNILTDEKFVKSLRISFPQPTPLKLVVSQLEVTPSQRNLLDAAMDKVYENVVYSYDAESGRYIPAVDSSMLDYVWDLLKKGLSLLGSLGKTIIELAQKVKDTVMDLVKRFTTIASEFASLLSDFLYDMFVYVANFFKITLPNALSLSRLRFNAEADDLLVPESLSEEERNSHADEPIPSSSSPQDRCSITREETEALTAANNLFLSTSYEETHYPVSAATPLQPMLPGSVPTQSPPAICPIPSHPFCGFCNEVAQADPYPVAEPSAGPDTLNGPTTRPFDPLVDPVHVPEPLTASGPIKPPPSVLRQEQDAEEEKEHPFLYLKESMKKMFGSFSSVGNIFADLDVRPIRNATAVMAFLSLGLTLTHRLATYAVTFVRYTAETIAGRPSQKFLLDEAEQLLEENSVGAMSLAVAKRLVDVHHTLSRMNTSFTSTNPLTRAYERLMVKMQSRVQEARIMLRKTIQRIEPMSIHLVGAADVGKTTLVQLISRALMGYTSDQENFANMYQWSRQGYQDHYREQPVITIEDIFNERNEEIDIQLVSDILQIVSNNHFEPPTATPEKKGDRKVAPELFITTSNSLSFPASASLRDPNAYLRRRTIVVEVMRSEQFNFMPAGHPYSKYLFVLKNKFVEMDHRFWIPMDFMSFMRYLQHIKQAYAMLKPTTRSPDNPKFDFEEVISGVALTHQDLYLDPHAAAVFRITNMNVPNLQDNATIRTALQAQQAVDEMGSHFSLRQNVTEKTVETKKKAERVFHTRSAQGMHKSVDEFVKVLLNDKTIIFSNAFKKTTRDVAVDRGYIEDDDLIIPKYIEPAPSWMYRFVKYIMDNGNKITLALAGITTILSITAMFLQLKNVPKIDFVAHEHQNASGNPNIKAAKAKGIVKNIKRPLLRPKERVHQGTSHVLAYYDRALLPLVFRTSHGTRAATGLVVGGAYVLTNTHVMKKFYAAWHLRESFTMPLSDGRILDFTDLDFDTDVLYAQDTDICLFRMPSEARKANTGMKDVLKYFIRSYSSSNVILGTTTFTTFRKVANVEVTPGILMELTDPKFSNVHTASGATYEEVICAKVKSVKGACGSLLLVGHDSKIGGIHITGDEFSADFQPIDAEFVVEMIRTWDPKFMTPSITPVSISEIPDTQDQPPPATVLRDTQDAHTPVILEADQEMVFRHRAVRLEELRRLRDQRVVTARRNLRNLPPIPAAPLAMLNPLNLHSVRWPSTLPARTPALFSVLSNTLSVLFLALISPILAQLTQLSTGLTALLSLLILLRQAAALFMTAIGGPTINHKWLYVITLIGYGLPLSSLAKLINLEFQNPPRLMLLPVSKKNVYPYSSPNVASLAYSVSSLFLFWFTLATLPSLFCLTLLAMPLPSVVLLVLVPLGTIFIAYHLFCLFSVALSTGVPTMERMSTLSLRMLLEKRTAFSHSSYLLAIALSFYVCRRVFSVFESSVPDSLSIAMAAQYLVVPSLCFSIPCLIDSSFARQYFAYVVKEPSQVPMLMMNSLIIFTLPYVMAISETTTCSLLIMMPYLLSLLKSLPSLLRGECPIHPMIKRQSYAHMILYLIAHS